MEYCTANLVFFFSSVYFTANLYPSFLAVFVFKASSFHRKLTLWRSIGGEKSPAFFWPCWMVVFFGLGVLFLSIFNFKMWFHCSIQYVGVYKRKSRKKNKGKWDFLIWLFEKMITYDSILFSLTGTHKNVLETKNESAGKLKSATEM